MATVKITEDRLRELSMLADWQLREMGFDPDSVTAAVLRLDSPCVRLVDESGRQIGC
jgi:hypothetical protein